MAEEHFGTSSSRVWPGWPSMGYIAATGIVLMAVVGLALLFRVVQQVFFIAFFGLLFAVIVDYPVSWLSRWLPRGLAIAVTLLALVALAFALGWISIPMLITQGRELVQSAPGVLDRIQEWMQTVLQRSPVSGAAGTSPQEIEQTLRERVMAELEKVAGMLFPLAMGILTFLSTMVAIVALAFFMDYAPESYERATLHLVPDRYVEPTREYLRRMVRVLQHWMGGQLIAMTITGSLTAIGLLLVGVESWYVLGVLAFFGEFVPYIGPIVSAVPGLAVGFAESSSTGLWVLLVYLVVQQLESWLLQPVIMRKAVQLRPVVLLVWQITMGLAFGMLGVIIATPLLAVAKTTVDFWYVERTLGRESDSAVAA